MSKERIESLQIRLVNALDRQWRAETGDAWFADERVIESVLSELVELGQDRGQMLDAAIAKVSRMCRSEF